MNKNVLWLAAAICIGIFTAFRFYSTPVIADGGIEFFQGTWKEALEKSKQENKPIFLDISASWCGPCKKLKRNTFSDKVVGSYFNERFINVALDGEIGEGVELANQLAVRGYPSLFVVGNNGKVLSSTVGYHDPKDLLEFGESGLKKFKPAN